MLEVLGEKYYIDVDKIVEKCRPTEQPEPEEPTDGEEKQLELNVFKFDCYKACLDRVLSEFQDADDQDVAAFTNKSENPSFAIAFNTLEKNEILIEDE